MPVLAAAAVLAHLAPAQQVVAEDPCGDYGYLRSRTEPCTSQPQGTNTTRCCLQWKLPATPQIKTAQAPITFYEKMSFASGYDVRYAQIQLNRAYKAGFLPNVMYTWDPVRAADTIHKRWRGLWDQCVTGKSMWDHSEQKHAELRKDMFHKFVSEQYENLGKHCLDFVVPIYGMWSGFRDIQVE